MISRWSQFLKCELFHLKMGVNTTLATHFTNALTDKCMKEHLLSLENSLFLAIISSVQWMYKVKNTVERELKKQTNKQKKGHIVLCNIMHFPAQLYCIRKCSFPKYHLASPQMYIAILHQNPSFLHWQDLGALKK